MNDLEEAIYTKGLENLYGSILLGEEWALNCTECLVYLTRALAASEKTWQMIGKEVTFVKCFCSVCWPDMQLQIQQGRGISEYKVARGRVSGEICRTLLELKSADISVNQLNIRKDGEVLRYSFSNDGVVLTKRVIAHV